MTMANDNTSEDDSNLTLTTNDILGIIQRGLMELNAYLSQAPQSVDPAIVEAYFERMGSFVGRLPRRVPMPNTSQDTASIRKN